MTLLLVVTFMFVNGAAALAQNRPITPGKRIAPPVAGRPVNFSFIEGKFSLEVSATPTEVHVEDAIRLEIRLTGSGPKEGEPDRKYLRNLFPASWEKDFYVQEMRDEHKVLREEKTWLFVYRLKPRHANVKAIDGVTLVYYDSAYLGAKGYIQQPADRIALKVTPRPDTPPDVKLDVSAMPESFYDADPAGDVLAERQTPRLPSLLEMGLFLAIVPALSWLGVFTYRRLCPDELTAALRFRHAAVERAQARLQTGIAAWIVVERYLCERFDFPSSDATPAEVADFLLRHGFSKKLCEEVRTFFQSCDALRFTYLDAPERHADAALGLMQALEADPCARR